MAGPVPGIVSAGSSVFYLHLFHSSCPYFWGFSIHAGKLLQPLPLTGLDLKQIRCHNIRPSVCHFLEPNLAASGQLYCVAMCLVTVHSRDLDTAWPLASSANSTTLKMIFAHHVQSMTALLTCLKHMWAGCSDSKSEPETVLLRRSLRQSCARSHCS